MCAGNFHQKSWDFWVQRRDKQWTCSKYKRVNQWPARDVSLFPSMQFFYSFRFLLNDEAPAKDLFRTKITAEALTNTAHWSPTHRSLLVQCRDLQFQHFLQFLRFSCIMHLVSGGKVLLKCVYRIHSNSSALMVTKTWKFVHNVGLKILPQIHAFFLHKIHQFHLFLCAKSLVMKGVGVYLNKYSSWASNTMRYL